MLSLAINPERERLEEIAEEYREQGYEVLFQPGTNDLPLFLHTYQPDLIVRKGDQSIVVEAKTRQALSHNARIREMARVLHETDGWQFNLTVVGASENGVAFDNSLSEEEVRQNLAEAQSLLGSGYANAAILLAWSSAEATLRLIGQQDEPPIVQENPPHLIKALAMEGAISRVDYDFLLETMQRRNAVAHGYRSSNDTPQVVEKLIETTQRLIAGQPDVA